jgi:hypothetical protein
VVEQINSIWHSGTHGAYVNLIEGNANFILVARLPSEDELQAAQESGVVLDVQAVALDAFVFLVNAENFDSSANVLWCKWTDVYWLKFGVTMLAKLVYNQTGVCTPTKPSPDRAIGRRQKRGVSLKKFQKGRIRNLWKIWLLLKIHITRSMIFNIDFCCLIS